MRTTISFDERVLARARKKAEQAGLSLSAFVEQAVRRELDQVPSSPRRKPFRPVTFGAGGLKPGYSWERLDQQGLDKPGMWPYTR